MTVIGDTAFVADGYDGLQVIDVSTPSQPVTIGSADTSGRATGVTVIGDTAFVSDGYDGLQMIDVSIPSQPVIIGSVDTSGHAYGVTVIGDTVFVADGGAGLVTVPLKAVTEIRPVTANSETDITVTLPSPPAPGNYTLRVFNGEEYYEMPGAVTFSEKIPTLKVTSDLQIKAVIHTEEKGPVIALWQRGGEDETARGDKVLWGHFYANPEDVTWGNENNPDLFVKIWFDVNGRVDVNFFHVSVPDIEVYSDYKDTLNEHGVTTLDTRYIRHWYKSGRSGSDENYEDGIPPAEYQPSVNPSGYTTINDLRFGSLINTAEKGLIEAVWQLGGQDKTAGGHQVVWGHFYASPSDVGWGSPENPDLFVKIWFDISRRIDVNFFHVSVPDIEVYSDFPSDGDYDKKGRTVLEKRYVRHEYWR